MTSAPPATAITPRIRDIAMLLLAALLILLATRLTGAESLRDTLSQRQARLVTTAQSSDTSLSGGIFIGPPHIVVECAVLMAIAGTAAALAAFSTGLSRRHGIQFLLIAAFLACGMQSTLQAGNRFNAVIGLTDIAMALMAGWTISLLCTLLGDQGRRIAIAGLVAILTLWVCKGLLQYFVEMPDTIATFREHRDEYLRKQGIIDDPVQTKLFESRLNSNEVLGYIASSNVFASGLIGLLTVVAGTIVCGIKSPRPSAVESPTRQREPSKPPSSEPSGNISIRTLSLMIISLLALAGILLLPLTGSKGGTAIGFFTVIVVFLTGIFWHTVISWRRTLLAITLITVFGIAALTLSYGIRNDALPSKSLLFRWHYWTAAKPMIEQFPLWGVGLNNFGDYYLQFKRPSSPEDVKDPHSFFIRLAAEMGFPAALLIAILVVWSIYSVYRNTIACPPDVPPAPTIPVRPTVLIAAAISAVVWVAIHLLFFTEQVEFNVYIALIFAFAATGIFAVTMMLLAQESSNFPMMRYLCFTATLGAAAMLAYDQINMALVTGPVAMLFWVLLGIGASLSPSTTNKPSPTSSVTAWTASAACTATAAVLLLILWLPLHSNSLPWDPAPFENQYLQRAATGDPRVARTALEAAMQRSPNSIELLMRHISLLRDTFHEPAASEIRKVLSLDRANARIRVQLALVDSDLPPNERAAILDQAIVLDSQLPEDEYKRLPPDLLPKIKMKISELQSAGK